VLEKKIFLSISGIQRSPDGQNNNIELITEGRLYKKGNCTYIEYEESEISGMEGVKTLIVIDGERVSLERSGSFQTQFVFEKGKKFVNFYSTPFGSLEMAVYPIKVDSDIRDNEGKLDLKYQLDIGGKYASSNELLVNYTDSYKSSRLQKNC